MANQFTKKRKIFPAWLENKAAKTAVLVALALACLYFVAGGLQTAWEQSRCASRGYTWFSIPPSGRPGITQFTRDSVGAKTDNHYRENYMWGVCANMNEVLRR